MLGVRILPNAGDLIVRGRLINTKQNARVRAVEAKEKVDGLRKKILKYKQPSFGRKKLIFRRIDVLQKQAQGISTGLNKAKRDLLNARITSLKFRISRKKTRKMRRITFDIRNRVRLFKKDTEYNCNMIRAIYKNKALMQLRKQDKTKQILEEANQNLQKACAEYIQTKEYLKEYYEIFVAV